MRAVFFLSKVVISITHVEREREREREGKVAEGKRDRERCKRNHWEEIQICDEREIGH